MTAAILCGGLGTRLRSLIGEHQKCAVDIGNRPWIHRVMDAVYCAGVDKAILLTGYQSAEIEAAAGCWTRPGGRHADIRMEVSCLRSKPMGPDAAVQLAFATTKAHAMLVINGDTLPVTEDRINAWGAELEPPFNLTYFLADCEKRAKTVILRGWSITDPKAIVDAGIIWRHPGKPEETWPRKVPFLDIGSPAGLAEARARFET